MDKRLDNENTNICEELNEDIFMAIFRKGAYEYLEDGINEFRDFPNFSLPETGEKKILNLINKQVRKEKVNRILKKLVKIAAIFFIIVTVCTITIISVEALRVPILNLFTYTEEKITDIEFIDNQSNVEGVSFEDCFEYVPEGFELASEEIDGLDASLIYTNMDEESIFIDMYYGGSSLGVDTENAEYGEIIINESKGFYSTKNGSANLVFTKNEYVYSIIANLDLSEIIKIAENIK